MTLTMDELDDLEQRANHPTCFKMTLDPSQVLALVAAARRGIAREDTMSNVEQDARRYRRLQVLGCAPYSSASLDKGTVLRFGTLDDFVDDDLQIHPSRGEAFPVAAGQLQTAPSDIVGDNASVAPPPTEASEEWTHFCDLCERRVNRGHGHDILCPHSAEVIPSSSDVPPPSGRRGLDPYCPVHIGDASNPKACTCAPSSDVAGLCERLRHCDRQAGAAFRPTIYQEAYAMLQALIKERSIWSATRAANQHLESELTALREKLELTVERAALLEMWNPPATIAIKDASIQMLQAQLAALREREQKLAGALEWIAGPSESPTAIKAAARAALQQRQKP